MTLINYKVKFIKKCVLIRIIFTQIEPSKEIPIYLDYTVWSVTNADELANGAMPRYTSDIGNLDILLKSRYFSFEEAGPYSYRETRIKQNIQVVGGDRAR